MRVDPSATAGRRRVLLRGAALAAAWVGAGLPWTRAGAAAPDPFAATSLADALRALGARPVPSSSIDLDLPDLSENGALVPVAVTSRLPGTTRIALLAEANPYPLIARFEIAPGTDAYVATRVKLAQSCQVLALVAADGGLFAATRATAVTEGGCGG